MCGIAGMLDLMGRAVEKPVLKRLCDTLAHRGPDEEGYFLRNGTGLGQRRLSIIDLSTGRQPLGNEDGTVWVTFNGEIYNFQELRQRLEKAGHRFATHSDTEVIVHAYEQYGVECVRQFRGMFAFALWDERQRTLFLARDRVGKKPLFHTHAGGQFLFASELQALVQHPAVSRETDLTSIDDYLTYGYIPAPRTIYRGVFKLPPAHWLLLNADSGDTRMERYWRLEYAPKLDLHPNEAAEGLLEVLTEAVRLRLIADVPVGALLSGGVDSSLVVALMSRLSSQPVRTFSIGFEEQEFNELPFARLVAQRYATDHHEFVVRPNALEVLPKLIRHYGEPYADSSAIPSYYVAQLTRQHVKVALNGDGGDESFGGYERYLGSALADRYQRIPRLVRRALIEPVVALIPDRLGRRNRLRQAKRFLQQAGHPTAERYLRWISTFRPAEKEALYSAEFRDLTREYHGEAWLLDLFESIDRTGLTGIDALMAVDVQSYLPYDLLVKMDIATMANSLEARSPFLDHQVMEFAARLPVSLKVRGMTLKYLLKKVGRQLLPPQNLARRKMGFGVPVGHWMRHELRPILEEVLFSPGALQRGYFREDALRLLVRAHLEGSQDYSFHLWALVCLELWHREFAP
jgi:asparagine synthase (glutamine-hydrolysing)